MYSKTKSEKENNNVYYQSGIDTHKLIEKYEKGLHHGAFTKVGKKSFKKLFEKSPRSSENKPSLTSYHHQN